MRRSSSRPPLPRLPGAAARSAGLFVLLAAVAWPAPIRAQTVTVQELLSRPPIPPDYEIAYGTDSLQVGHLRLPEGEGPHPVVVLVHGGCWLSFAGFRHMDDLADELTDGGWATWNLEYRRVDSPGGGWPSTFLDVAQGVDHLRELATEHALDLERVVLLGHSSGGHLATWAAARPRIPPSSPLHVADPLVPAGVVALAGAVDLEAFRSMDDRVCGGDVIDRLLGGSPEEVPERYEAASPARMLPLGVPQRLITGGRDGAVPPRLQDAYAERAKAAGDDVEAVVIPGAGHFEPVAPWAQGWTDLGPLVREAVREVARPGHSLRDPAFEADDVLRILVYHDMEGLAGQDDWRTYDFRFPEQYRRGQELLAADLNAVVQGLFEGGADEVHVVDGHGSGNPEPDVRSDLLDPRADQVLRDEPFDAYTGLVEPGVYDAVAVVGMHAKSSSRGYASHTYTLGIELWLQGRSITETELVAFSWGRVGVPVIFASGDDVLREDLRAMPWIEYVTVKEAISADSARLRPVEEARAELRERARSAVEKLPRMGVLRLEAPARAAVRAVPPASLKALEGVPGIDYEDDTVRFTAADFQSIYDGWLALVGVAQVGYLEPLFQELREHPAGEEIERAAADRLDALWFDYESGRWSPPAAPEPEPARKYHGFN